MRRELSGLRRIVGRAALAGATVVACEAPQQEQRPTQSDTARGAGSAYLITPPDTASPPFGGALVGASVDSVLAYASRLRYDEAGKDSQRLMLGTRCPGDCRYGPLASIQPQAGSHALTQAQLARGRFIARLINHDSTDYAKLNLAARDTAYLWFYSDGTRWWGIYVSRRRRAVSRPHAARFERHERYAWYQPTARWLWSDRDDGGWVGCTLAGCCRVDDAQ